MNLIALWKRQWFLLSVLLLMLLGGFLRTYQLTAPLADWHSFRQADTASVTREFVKNGVDFLRPQYHDLSNIQSGKDNLDGWRMVEFPLVNGLLAYVLRAFPSLDLVVTSRVASILASVLSIGLLGWLIKSLHTPKMAVIAVTVFAVMPFAVFYGRTILPEPFLVLLVLLSAVSWRMWLEKNQRTVLWLLLSALAFAAALLVKPMAVFFLPLFAGIWLQTPRAESRGWKSVVFPVIAFGVSALPVLWWRSWIEQFPTGIPASSWLLNGNGIRLKPAWWRWLFADRLGRLMFGYWGAALLPFGLLATFPNETVQKRIAKEAQFFKRLTSFFFAWAQNGAALLGLTLGMFTYMVVFASGNVQHDYYQVLLLPWVAWLWAAGASWMLDRAQTTLEKYTLVAVLVFIGGFSWIFSWYHVKDWFQIQNPAIVQAGQAVDRLTPSDALIIAPYFGDTAFLFQTNRRGWPIGYYINEKIEFGAQYYVSSSLDDETKQLMQSYTVMESTDAFTLIDLTQPASEGATLVQP